MRITGLKLFGPLWVLLLAAAPLPGQADRGGGASRSPRDLTDISLEELMNVEVTSVSKKEQKLSRTAAAIYVITQEDIRRSGLTSIPELLRMVPGLQVARIDANKWAITARGFNARYSNKLLVLMDGRSVYTPLYSGVYWDIQDAVLEDIERIEVIRGPGATMWGANAVNGVINIITKHTRDTQGALATVGSGNEERAFGGVRYGTSLNAKAHLRVYSKYFDRRDLLEPSGQRTSDQWRMAHGGFRLDWDLPRKDALMVTGDVYGGRASERLAVPSLKPPFSQNLNGAIQPSGRNLLANWEHRFSDRSDMALRFDYDQANRTTTVLGEARETIDFDFQHRLSLSRHEIQWGAGYRFTDDDLVNSFTETIDPSRYEFSLFNGFIQDEFQVVGDRLTLTLGSKLERSGYSGFGVEPNVRLLWTPSPHHAAWAAVSRVARTPSRTERDLRVNVAAFPGAQGVTLVSILGSRNFHSENLVAYELGYRSQPASWLTLDIATFCNVYNHLRTFERTAPFFEPTPAPAHLVRPTRFANEMNGATYGAEIATRWKLTDRWRLSADYSWLRLNLNQPPERQRADAALQEGSSPKHQIHVHSYLDLPWKLQFDTGLYYVDSLRALKIPSYLRADLRLGWRPSPKLEFSLSGENLLDNQHPEFWAGEEGVRRRIEVGRSVYVRITWRY